MPKYLTVTLVIIPATLTEQKKHVVTRRIIVITRQREDEITKRRTYDAGTGCHDPAAGLTVGPRVLKRHFPVLGATLVHVGRLSVHVLTAVVLPLHDGPLEHS